MDPLAAAERGQAMLLKDRDTAIIIGLVLAVVALFGWVMAVMGKRISDLKESKLELAALAKDSVEVVKENSTAMFLSARTNDELRNELHEFIGKKRKAPKEAKEVPP